jgi:uncharacterized membrane protein
MKKLHSDFYLLLVLSLVSVILLMLPTGFESAAVYQGQQVAGRVISADDSSLRQYGIVKIGEQVLQVKISEGQYRGKTLRVINHLTGKMEIDSIFRPGDTVLVTLSSAPDGSLSAADAREHYRIPYEILIGVIFVVALVGYAGWIGAKALISFLFTGIAIWKIMIPAFLKGYDPVFVSLGVVLLLSAAIIFLVAGITRKATVAFSGAAAGIFITALIAAVFGQLFRINGAVRPFSEMLLYSGFPDLNLNKIFLAGVYLASSGALMDLAMDIAAAQHEIAEKRPDISRKELIRSGLTVGRHVIGTMTTTLLLAYSGGYTALLMIFMAKGVTMTALFNNHYVANEIYYTLAGSIGLVAVGPITALMGGVFLVQNTEKNN